LGTIENDDPEPVISVADVSAPEGDADTAEVLLAVELSHASALEVSVSYATVAGSATETADYEPVTGRLTFAPGETSQTIPILVVGDTLAEDDETLTFQLSEPTNASLAAVDAALVTIVDDDEDEPVTFPWQNPEVHEDVTGDGLVVPLDALLVINRLNALGSGPLPLPPAPPNVPPPYFDVSGDNIVAPIDALLVINFLNAQAAQSVAPRQTLLADEPATVESLSVTRMDESVASGEGTVDSSPMRERWVAADEPFWITSVEGHRKRGWGILVPEG
jgi:hypothetical protein